jgi:hypothetical protein
LPSWVEDLILPALNPDPGNEVIPFWRTMMKKTLTAWLFVWWMALTGAPGLRGQSQPNTLTPREVSDGWILLWDGQTTFGWESIGKAEWKMANGVLSSSSGDAGWLATDAPFADYVLQVDYRTGADGNSGIFLRSTKDGDPAKTGYELQICDTHKEYTTGGLVFYLKAKKVVTRPNEWHHFEIVADSDHFVVKVDGENLLDARENSHRVGVIGLQYNKDKAIEFRNIKLKPLGLNSLFNGKDLSGWKKVDSTNVPAPVHEWSVRQGMIHVEKGPGQLETETTFQDFVFQLEIRTNPKDANHHPNSGVFFRGDKGVFWSGYESQIRNEFKDGDRTQPVDFGTGAIYNRVATRRVIPNDGEFFSKTIVAHGRHMAVWVNGIPVTDFTDTRPEGSNARNEARLTGGTISLQAHDPTTNLEFKNLRILELPKR